MDKIYWLSSAVKFDDKLCYVPGAQMDKKSCPHDPRHHMRQRWKKPLRVIGPVRGLTDFEWTVFGDILVGPEIVSDFRSAGFSGIEFTPVDLFTTTETPIGRESYELKITGWGGYAPVESGIRVLKECPYCGRKVFSGFTNKEKLFDAAQWDGSDFFIIWPMPKKFFITDRVRKFMLERDYSGVTIHALGELRPAVAGTFTPGNLHDWFSASKVAEILRDRD